MSEGDTRNEALANMQKAMQLYLEPGEDDAAIAAGAEVIEISV